MTVVAYGVDYGVERPLTMVSVTILSFYHGLFPARIRVNGHFSAIMHHQTTTTLRPWPLRKHLIWPRLIVWGIFSI